MNKFVKVGQVWQSVGIKKRTIEIKSLVKGYPEDYAVALVIETGKKINVWVRYLTPRSRVYKLKGS